MSARPLAVADVVGGLAAVAGDGSATINWNAPLVLGGLTVLGYRIELCTVSAAACVASDTTNFTVLTASTGSTATTYSLNGLTNGTPYWFRVSAITGAGVGIGAVVSSVPGVVAGAPQSLTASAGDGQVTLVWNAATTVTGGGTISGFRVERSTDATNWTVISGNAGTSGTITVDGLTNGLTTGSVFVR